MSQAKEIKTLIKEAQIYQTQGLLKEARIRYEKAAGLVRSDETLNNKPQLLEGIEKKIQSIDAVSHKEAKKSVVPEISSRDRDLIKRLFSTASADDQDASILEGAVTLAKFGQFDRAIADFEELLENSPLRIVAAKHIIRCHMAMRALHDPMTQFQKWGTSGYFGKEELEELSTFLQKTYGLTEGAQEIRETHAPAVPEQNAPPEPEESASEQADGAFEEEETVSEQPEPQTEKPSFDPVDDVYIDVLESINLSSDEKGVDLPSKSNNDPVESAGASKKKQPLKYDDIMSDASCDYVDYVSSVGIPINAGEMIDLPVNLQTGSVVNLIVPAGKKQVMEILKKGERVEGVKLNSPISMNTGNCIVVSVARIDMGPKKGDYSVDLKIES